MFTGYKDRAKSVKLREAYSNIGCLLFLFLYILYLIKTSYKMQNFTLCLGLEVATCLFHFSGPTYFHRDSGLIVLHQQTLLRVHPENQTR